MKKTGSISSGVTISITTPFITGSFSLGNFQFTFWSGFVPIWSQRLKGITLYWPVAISIIIDDFWFEKMGTLFSKEVSCLAEAIFILLWRAVKCGRTELIEYLKNHLYVLWELWVKNTVCILKREKKAFFMVFLVVSLGNWWVISWCVNFTLCLGLIV